MEIIFSTIEWEMLSHKIIKKIAPNDANEDTAFSELISAQWWQKSNWSTCFSMDLRKPKKAIVMDS